MLIGLRPRAGSVTRISWASMDRAEGSSNPRRIWQPPSSRNGPATSPWGGNLSSAPAGNHFSNLTDSLWKHCTHVVSKLPWKRTGLYRFRLALIGCVLARKRERDWFKEVETS